MNTLELMLVFGSGIAATVTMTLIMYGYAAISKHPTQVIHILGNMLTARGSYDSLDTKSGVIGSLFHLGTGVFFTLSYYLLWISDVIDFSWMDGLFLGIGSGILAIAGWWLYLTCHHQAPPLSFKHYFAALFLAHLVFALTAVAVFRGFLPGI
jgi:hypothetical protein